MALGTPTLLLRGGGAAWAEGREELPDTCPSGKRGEGDFNPPSTLVGSAGGGRLREMGMAAVVVRSSSSSRRGGAAMLE